VATDSEKIRNHARNTLLVNKISVPVGVFDNNASISKIHDKSMTSAQVSDDYRPQGHFLYADYTPMEDNRNVIEMLKTYVSMTSGLIKLYTSNASLSSLLRDSDSLHNDIISAVKQIKNHTTSSIENYHHRNSEALATELHTEGMTLLKDTQTSLLTLLNDAETSFSERHQKYKENITNKISENEGKATALVNEWLSRDYLNLPQPVLTNLSSTVVALLDSSRSSEQYDIQREASSALSREGVEEKNALRFSYAAKIEAKELEFWNYRRKVSELGIRELMLPVGLKASISERFKQTFKFGQGSEVLKEPDFKKVDDYYIVRAELQGQKTLIVQLAADPARADDSIFTITYLVDGLSDRRPAERPRIDFRTIDNGQTSETTDMLQIGEIERMSDLPKIRLLGTAIMSKMGIITNQATIASRGRLDSLKTDNADIITPQKVDFDRLFEFLGLISLTLRPTLDKLREKTPVKDELIVRQEVPGGQRKEYTIRLDDLRSQLADERHGRPILGALGM
jgi:hypothetical protein